MVGWKANIQFVSDRNQIRFLFADTNNSEYLHFRISSSVQTHGGIVFLKEEINFQHMLKLDTQSKYFTTLKKLAQRYFEAGFIDKIFADIHTNSYK